MRSRRNIMIPSVKPTITEKISGEIISLPSRPALSEMDINFVCDKIKEFLEKNPSNL